MRRSSSKMSIERRAVALDRRRRPGQQFLGHRHRTAHRPWRRPPAQATDACSASHVRMSSDRRGHRAVRSSSATRAAGCSRWRIRRSTIALPRGGRHRDPLPRPDQLGEVGGGIGQILLGAVLADDILGRPPQRRRSRRQKLAPHRPSVIGPVPREQGEARGANVRVIGGERRVAGCAHLGASGQRRGALPARRGAASPPRSARSRRACAHDGIQRGRQQRTPAVRRVRRHSRDDRAPTRCSPAGTSIARPARRASWTRSEAASTSSSARRSSLRDRLVEQSRLGARRVEGDAAHGEPPRRRIRISSALRRVRRGEARSRSAVLPAARLGADTARCCR